MRLPGQVVRNSFQVAGVDDCPDSFLPLRDLSGGDEQGLDDAVCFPRRGDGQVGEVLTVPVDELVPGLRVRVLDDDLRHRRCRIVGVFEEDVPPEDPVVGEMHGNGYAASEAFDEDLTELETRYED